MLNTKDMQVGSGKARPLIGPGNNVVRINSITLDQTPYDSEAFNLNLHVETKPVGGDFEGFFRDKTNEALGRYEGQIGRVRMSPYPYKDTTLPSGREINRDQEILKAMIFLSEAVNKRSDLDKIEAATIEDFISKANSVLCGDFFNVCLASREWENKEGYINNDLYLPKLSKDGIPAESLDVDISNSRLITFNKAEHVREVQKKAESTVAATPTGNGVVDDFEL